MPPTWMKYAVTQGFGPTSEPLDSGGVNKGFDLATPIGTPIDAAVGGTVEHVGDAKDGWGISVKVRDAQGNLHNYGHLSAVNVRKGQTVDAGAVVGQSGNSGKSTGPHLSYDVSDRSGRFINPAPFLGEPSAPGRAPKKPGDPTRGLSSADEARLGPILRKISRGQTLTADEAVFAQPLVDQQNEEVRRVAEGLFGGGTVAAGKAGGVARSLLNAVRSHPKLAAGAGALAAWKLDVPFVGGDGEPDPQQTPDNAQLARIMQKIQRGETLLPEEVGILQSAAPDVYASYAEDTGAADGGGMPAIDPEGKGNADILDTLLREMVSKGDYDAKEVADLAVKAQNLRDAEAKRIRLDDGTVITSQMMEGADPLTRQQFQMELNRRTTDYENEATATLNKYALDQYTLGRQATNDANSNANNDYRNRVEAIRQRLDLDEINIKQAGQEMERLLKGMGESRARADLETSTAIQAAPFATKGGKTSFTGADLGASVSGLARIGGIAQPETTPLISFPGTQRIDVAGLMAQRDAQLGVAGQPLPATPTISVQPGDLPTPPGFASGPPLPTLTPPSVLPRIQVPRSAATAE